MDYRNIVMLQIKKNPKTYYSTDGYTLEYCGIGQLFDKRNVVTYILLIGIRCKSNKPNRLIFKSYMQIQQTVTQTCKCTLISHQSNFLIIKNLASPSRDKQKTVFNKNHKWSEKKILFSFQNNNYLPMQTAFF